ncbi:unconventional prefoldin RPB5 interactor 1 [Corythoichthys intestinalis]|uniref:unconventional prefoldin RPB5 interactor 1 n=1 Tax=Corythoichthys intestinalis TaxID=161448 RepID=UPI0025A66807|nr:unconventional prefoldin RPB5 interactor 1 [Corythoichthys intestinalis]
MIKTEPTPINMEDPGGVFRLREEHEKVVKDCKRRIQHWEKVSGDYEALKERLETLPDRLSYDIMVPFGPMAFMPGKLVHCNEVTVLLGDNWFAKCSTKQAEKIVDHRLKYVKNELCGLSKTMTNFESRVKMVKDLENIVNEKGDYVDIREVIGNNDDTLTKGKRRMAHRPNSKPKLETVLDLEEESEGSGSAQQNGSTRSVMTQEELWARLDELEKIEELQNERDSLSDNVASEDTSSSSSEEQNESDSPPPENGHAVKPQDITPPSGEAKEEYDDEHYNLPTIYFSHTVEPKKVRINTSKNTTLKFSERKEQKDHSKKKKRNGHHNGHAHHEVHKIQTPVDIYRLFVDVKDGEPVPKKSILKSRSRENSVCSDTSESSAADLDERRLTARSFSHDESAPSDNSDSLTEEDGAKGMPSHPGRQFEAFSGTVVEKDPMPSSVPLLTIGPPALPTIIEWKQEDIAPDADVPQAPVKRVSKFKAARMQHK